MIMKAYKIIRKYIAKDGREVTFRTPSWDDLDDFLEFINALFLEGAMISATSLKTRQQEAEWLGRHLALIENNMRIAVVAEVEGKVVGQVEVNPKSGHSKHVGILGISIKNGFRDIGIGTELMKEAEGLAREYGLTHMTLEVYSMNERARHVYEKLGYTLVGIEPDSIIFNGKSMDTVIMYKKIE
ncbi:GNAT family N-acetyltransferase [Candidatus Bathyarchaeota archaeon]|nr:GNAT family N-acetyltransferase [Candidatus Bathyarchaeota archaeon]